MTPSPLPKCPWSVAESVPENGECPKSVPRVSLECQKVSRTLWGHSRDTFWTLRSPGPGGPRRHPVGHSLGHPPLSGTLSGTLRGHFGPEGPRDSSAWSASSRLISQKDVRGINCEIQGVSMVLGEYQESFSGNDLSNRRPTSADCKRGRWKGATSKNFKNRQKVFRHFSHRAKNVKHRRKVSKSFSTLFARHLFSGPFWGAPTTEDINMRHRHRSRRFGCSIFFTLRHLVQTTFDG